MSKLVSSLTSLTAQSYGSSFSSILPVTRGEFLKQLHNLSMDKRESTFMSHFLKRVVAGFLEFTEEVSKMGDIKQE